MTTQVVADDVLGRISKRFWDLFRRIRMGSVNEERAAYFMQMAAENPPQPTTTVTGRRQYVLECYWAWDNSHYEFATISFEECDDILPLELLCDVSQPESKRHSMLDALKRIFDEQIPKYGSCRMRRIYRVLGTRFLGYFPGTGFNGTLSSRVVDYHLTLEPVCDFDDHGNPIPCTVES